ncbi:MAG TPA: NAD-dependent epimerase/dehydratase family protein, partial [Gammaproteobacteria bacterium]|nr:NAD-dependent epimerase/dehydratase family protein [Gammaproteobacteria bacterium]
DEMHLHRAAATAVAAAMHSCGTRCVHVSSYWSFLPLVGTPMNEDHPRQGGTPWMQARRAAEDILREAGAAIANLPDFYGPGVHTSTLQQALVDAAHGRTINWIGAKDTERAYCYLPDAAVSLVSLAESDEAYGEHWLIPTAGPLSGRRVAEIASRAQAAKIKLRSGGLTALRLFSLVNPPLRPFMQIVPEYVRPISFETVKIEHLLGPQQVTAYEEGIKQTIEWLGAEASGL